MYELRWPHPSTDPGRFKSKPTHIGQESLANAKVSARHQRVYEGPCPHSPVKKCTANQRKGHIKLKSTFSGLQLCRCQYGSVFIRYLLLPPKSANSLKVRTYSSSRSSKVIVLGVNRQRICNFLLVINSNFGRNSYRFRDIDTFTSKIAWFPHPTLVWRSLAKERPSIST